jgi:hypothetical protein
MLERQGPNYSDAFSEAEYSLHETNYEIKRLLESLKKSKEFEDETEA